MTFTYFLRAARKEGMAYVVCKLRYHGQTKPIQTGICIDRALWDTEAKRPVLEADAAQLRVFDDRLRLAIAAARHNESLSLEGVALALESNDTGQTLPSARQVLEWHMHQVRSTGVQSSTLTIYANQAARLDTHLRGMYPNVEAEKFSREKALALKAELLKTYAEGTTAKSLDFLKWAFRSALSEGLIRRDPLCRVKFPKPEPSVCQLTRDQVAQIRQTRMPVRMAEKARLIFLLALESGAAYGDVFKICPENIVTGDNGLRLVCYQRQKNGKTAYVPVRPELEALWADGVHRLRMSCQAINREIKNVCMMAWGVPVLALPQNEFTQARYAEVIEEAEDITFHYARRTFGQFRIDEGYSIEAVAAMLGHSDIKTTQRHYCKPGLDRVSREMANRLCA